MSSGSCLGRHECWITWEEEDAVLNFSDDLMEQLGWKDGDDIEWEEKEDGTFVLFKNNHG